MPGPKPTERTLRRRRVIESMRKDGASDREIARALELGVARISQIAGPRRPWERAHTAELERQAAVAATTATDSAEVATGGIGAPKNATRADTAPEPLRTDSGRARPGTRIAQAQHAQREDRQRERMHIGTLRPREVPQRAVGHATWYERDGRQVEAPSTPYAKSTAAQGVITESDAFDMPAGIFAELDDYRDGRKVAIEVRKNSDGEISYEPIQCSVCHRGFMYAAARDLHQESQHRAR